MPSDNGMVIGLGLAVPFSPHRPYQHMLATSAHLADWLRQAERLADRFGAYLEPIGDQVQDGGDTGNGLVARDVAALEVGGEGAVVD